MDVQETNLSSLCFLAAPK